MTSYINTLGYLKCSVFAFYLIIFFSFLWATNSFGFTEKNKMQKIPEGCFMMGWENGYEDEKPRHEVCLDSFSMDLVEVTQLKFEKVIGNNPSQFRGEDLPVEGVTWGEANKYCAILGKRLPTEAEFEYASRAGTKTKYYWGNYIGQNNANCIGCGSIWDGTKTSPVGSFTPNPWGLYDMIGNVWEWVNDWYYPRYSSNKTEKNPKGPRTGTEKVFRSSSWYYFAQKSLSSTRNSYYPNKRFLGVGFRCVKENI